ncbi:MAG TPA: flavodoxin [Bacteroidales bacterium]|nr:flavodoxin [Bacteroidales bacterium]
MSKIGIFFASAMGNTETAAMDIKNEFGDDKADVVHVTDADTSVVEKYDYLVIGGSTWGAGEVQDDMDDFFDEIDKAKLKGKKVALFGLGDQEAYPFAFADSLGKLYDHMNELDVEIVGAGWPTDGYQFDSSKAERDGKFVGLVLDVDVQPDKTAGRIKKWVTQLKKEFK